MKLSEFDYQISREQIAQYPLSERDASRLFVIHREAGVFEHGIFRDIVSFLEPGDVLVLNDTKVIPARVYGRKPSGGKVEVMLLQEKGRNEWNAIVKGLQEGRVVFGEGIAAMVSRSNGSCASVRFEIGPNELDIRSVLHRIGTMPLPPYIKREAVANDTEQYQTIYAVKDGAVAAPTAGLHFTQELLDMLKRKGVDVRTITLHVGYGTFKPVTSEIIEQHRMDAEYYEIPEETARTIYKAKGMGRRVVAVGTTVTRTLEASAIEGGTAEDLYIKHGTGEASIFIYPGYRFKVIDALITNFHQPRSTPMMLTSAFAGLQSLQRAYSVAQEAGYRFFSYGDAMLVI